MSREAKKPRAKPGPKPRGPFEGKRKTLTTRITEETRERLEQAAESTGRSLSQEIELRLERAFLEEHAKFEEFGGEGIYRFMKVLAAVVGVVEHRVGKKFDEDPYTRSQAIITLERLLEGYLIEAGGEASEQGRGLLYGDPPIGKEIGDQLRVQVLGRAIERMKTGEPSESGK